jgi:hypothetical protein
MWSRKDKDGDTILVATHVDDNIVTGSNDEKIDAFIAKLLDRFDGTCERNLTEMLGMECLCVGPVSRLAREFRPSDRNRGHHGGRPRRSSGQVGSVPEERRGLAAALL